MKLSTLLVAAILMAVLLTTATARWGGRGGRGGHSKMKYLLCEVTNTTSLETCTNTCPDFAPCTEKVRRRNRTSDMVIKFCKPKECDPEVEGPEREGSCPAGSTCTIGRARRSVIKSRCMPADIETFTVVDGEVPCELPKRTKGGRRGGRRHGRRRGGRRHDH